MEDIRFEGWACHFAECPGCVPLSHPLEVLMASYCPQVIPKSTWTAHGPEARCVIRRSRPRSESQVRTRLAALAGFAGWADAPTGMLTEHLHATHISRFVTTTYSSASTQSRMQSRLHILRCAAHGLPLPEDLRARTHRGPARTPRTSTTRELELLLSGTPTMQCLQALDLSAGQLQTLVQHLPTPEIASHWEVLRG